MKASDVLMAKLKELEEYRDRAYLCPAGVWTIGYGHTRGVRRGQRCTRGEADRWLREDLAPVEAWCSGVEELRTQGRFDAVADFCFNLGIGAFKGSTLYRKIRGGRADGEIQAEFRRWVYAGGRVMPGLVRRREWEARRWTE